VDFTFSEEQQFFESTLADFLKDNVTAEQIRQRWESAEGFDKTTWQSLSELGITAALVQEANGGLGLSFEDCILLMQACGRSALPEPIIEHSFIAAALLEDVHAIAPSQTTTDLLADVAAGEKVLMTSHVINPHTNMAQSADAFLIQFGDDIHLVDKSEVQLKTMKSLDPSRRMSSLDWQPSAKSCLLNGVKGSELWQRTLNRGALATAAQLLGLAEAMVSQAVKYASDREQFGKPIGTNQAVKHLLADCAVQIEFAKPVIHRAAYTVSVAPNRADWAVSHAKVCASEAAKLAARHCTQVFGAMGYTWECDLHIWAKRAWVLDKEWGDNGFHKNRIHEWLLQPKALLGPEFTFGRRYLGDANEVV
jgi:alkylation response protein AidB-like acyl-CoA dehydrogenase